MSKKYLLAAFLGVVTVVVYATAAGALETGFDTSVPVNLTDKAEIPIPGKALPVLRSQEDLSGWGQFIAVKELRLETTYRCEAGAPYFSVTKELQHFSVVIDDSDTYLHIPAGYEAVMEGERPGAKVYLRKTSGQNKFLVGAAGQPYSDKCSAAGRSYLPLQIADKVSVSRGKRVRTGFLRPVCYKNIITGTSTLEYWNILRIAFEGGSVDMEGATSANFLKKEECLKFYHQVTGD